MDSAKCCHCGKELSGEDKKRGECTDCLIVTETAERKFDQSPECRAMDDEAAEAEVTLTPEEEVEWRFAAEEDRRDQEWRDARREYFENYEDVPPSMDEPGGSDWNDRSMLES